MNDVNHFLVYLLVSMVVYFAVLTFTVRKRSPRHYLKLFLLTLVITAGGMLFGRYTYGKGLPWWIYYGIPVLMTYLFPMAILHLSRKELLQYTPLAILMAPAIHVFFSFFFGWYEYMPLFYVPWWRELIS